MSNAFFYSMIISGKVDPATVEDFQSDCVDVRDTSLAHVRAIEIEEAGDQRFINTGYGFIWQDFRKSHVPESVLNDRVTDMSLVDEVNSLRIPGLRVAVGKPGRGKDFKYRLRYANDKSQKVLGKL